MSNGTMYHLHGYEELENRKFRTIMFRFLIKPLEAKKEFVTHGGVKLYKPDDTVSREQAAMNFGRILQIGADVFDRSHEVPPQPGDIIAYYSHTGRIIQCPTQGEVVVLNDTDVLGVFDPVETKEEDDG